MTSAKRSRQYSGKMDFCMTENCETLPYGR